MGFYNWIRPDLRMPRRNGYRKLVQQVLAGFPYREATQRSFAYWDLKAKDSSEMDHVRCAEAYFRERLDLAETYLNSVRFE